MRKFGLIGFPLGHSFSKKYFSAKFEREGITDCLFELYEIPNIAQFPSLLKENSGLKGLAVTIPYKNEVISYLDELDEHCATIGAVNCIDIQPNKLKGYNTDYIGFKNSLSKWLGHRRPKALVLGTGGASKAVKQALKDSDISFIGVSRSAGPDLLTYSDLANDPSYLHEHHLIINTTPLGTFPKVEDVPPVPINQLTASHLVYDLVYNPAETALMRACIARGGSAKNGLEMLELQAEAAWDIWNS